MATSGPLFLGLDLSTQQLKAVVIAETGSVVHQTAVHFDRDLPNHGTTNGATHGEDGEVTSPVIMWLEAVDLLFTRLKESDFDLSAIVAVSGAGQQHGSVYWSEQAAALLKNLDPSRSLSEQLHPAAFSILESPIWQDSSTTRECKALEEAIGGPQALADLTGSRAYERFTGNQIARIRRLKPEKYQSTAQISLISAFATSLFLGWIAPAEVSDASGMNLMDVLSGRWNEDLLTACGGPELRTKIGPEPVPGGVVLGEVHEWWVNRWGFNPRCIVAPFTGDNPASVVALSAPGDAVLSLGTSTTFLLSIPPAPTPPKRFTTSHLLSHPTDPHGQIAMLCYKNGALAREHVRNVAAGKDWETFNKLVEQTPPGNNGALGFIFPLPEIIPPNVVGNHFFKTQPDGHVQRVEDLPLELWPRAILESQFLSIRSRVVHILPENAPHLHRMVITGGSSANQTIRQIIADIFDMEVFVSETHEAAGLGGGLLAKFAWWKSQGHGKTNSFEDMTDSQVLGLKRVAKPNEAVTQIYAEKLKIYDECEALVVNGGSRSKPAN